MTNRNKLRSAVPISPITEAADITSCKQAVLCQSPRQLAGGPTLENRNTDQSKSRSKEKWAHGYAKTIFL
jgi:hypothetical protein